MEIEMSARDIWYLTDHLIRHSKWQEKERRKTKRILKRAHKDWLVNQALNQVRADSLAVYKRAQRAWW